MNFKKKIVSWRKSLVKEFNNNTLYYIVLAAVLFAAFFVRIYRTRDLMGFYYDQGRDALVIWKLWHDGKLFLTGPVSGLAGIFLGPLYYYLIAPFYLIGGGDPVFPSIFLSAVSVLSIMILYFLGWKMHSRTTGFIAFIIGSFSYYLVLSGRWLANPTPIFLSGILLLFCLWKITSDKKVSGWYFIWSFVLIGISLQFESASAVFYLPMMMVFLLWQKSKVTNIKVIYISVFVFILTLLPQVFFNFRHDNLIFNSFKRVLITEKSFRNPLSWENLKIKKDFLWNTFDSKIFPVVSKSSVVFYIASVSGLFLGLKKTKKELKLLLIFIGIPFLGYIFFQGNEGHIYDYYLTGYYLPLVLLFSIGLGNLWKNKAGKILVISFILVFLNINLKFISGYLKSSDGGPTGITLGTELKAVDWIYGNSKDRGEFNVDIYVPPVIPHSYDYLLLWRGTKFCGKNLCGYTDQKKTPLLYTLFEEDPPHPDRLQIWLERQKDIGKVVEEIRFGNVTVQRRLRL